MKEKYIKPFSDVQKFPILDILTISLPTGGDDGDGPIELPDFPLDGYFS